MRQMRKTMAIVLAVILLLGMLPLMSPASAVTAPSERVKVLLIGNSHSRDGGTYIYDIATAAGYTDAVVGIAFINGAGITDHYTNIINDMDAYTYRKTAGGVYNSTNGNTLDAVLSDENWDMVILQEKAPLAGMVDCYNADLTYLAQAVRSKVKNPNLRMGWYMTWAYSADFKGDEFYYYDCDQMGMYLAVARAVEEKIHGNPLFDVVFPVGTAVQNARSGYVGDTLNRDGNHLLDPLGFYLAGLCFFKGITGEALSQWDTLPGADSDFSPIYWPLLRDSVEDAYRIPYAFTRSVHLTEPTLLPMPNAAIDYQDEVLTGLNGTYRFNGGQSIHVIGAYPIQPEWFGTTVRIVQQGDGTTTLICQPQELSIPARPNLPHLQQTDCTTPQNNNGTISGVTMGEYSINGVFWQDIPGEALTGLTPGRYHVRIKASAQAFTSNSVVVGVGAYVWPNLIGSVYISGETKYGSTLKVVSSGLTASQNSSRGTLSYRWQRDNVDIPGATSAAYMPVEADIGKNIRVLVTASNCKGVAVSTQSISIVKADAPAAPAKPEVKSKTTNSITLKKVSGMEYRCGSGPWQSGTTFSNLKKNTKYTFTMRHAATATRKASVKSAKLTVTTPKGTTAKPNSKAVPNSKRATKGYTVTLAAPKGTVLYYTTNGKKPTVNTKTKVKAGKKKKLTINKNTKVRVIAVKNGYLPSTAVTKNYRIR